MNRQPQGVRRTTVRLPPDLLHRLKLLANARNCTRSAIITDLLRSGVAAQEQRHAAS